MVKLNLDFQKDESSIIKVIGVGGGGGNAVNFMFREGITGVEFLVVNTDNQHLEKSPIDNKLQIGSKLTAGRGVGGNPEIGRRAAIEDIEKIKMAIGNDTKMIFITAGMGGGTGTGAAPVLAKLAREMELLTVGIVTYPFKHEGKKREKCAEEGIEEMRKYCDALLVIKNEKLLEIFRGLPASKAFSFADNVLATAAKGIAEIITVPGEMNVDFEDVKAIMKNSGTAIMGNGTAEGEDRATKAVKNALNSPLLKEKDITGAKHILLNLSYGSDELRIDEITQITEYISDEVGDDVDMKLGICYNHSLGAALSVTLVATSLEGRPELNDEPPLIQEKVVEEQNTESVIEEETTELSPEAEQQMTFYLEEDEEKAELHEQLSFDFNKPYEPYYKSQKPGANKQVFDLRNPATFDKIESIPAYLRKNVQLSDVASASTNEASRFVLEDDYEKRPEIKEDNPFLSDNVD